MRHRYVSALGTALLAVALFAACSSSKGQQIPDPGPMPDGADFEGVWFSPQYKHMYLTQSGDRVTGVYSYERGGKLTGTVQGDLLKFEWRDAGAKQSAQRSMKGRGFLKLVEEDGEKKLEGEWGYGERYRGAGPWTAEYIRTLESNDPSTIDELEDSDEPMP